MVRYRFVIATFVFLGFASNLVLQAREPHSARRTFVRQAAFAQYATCPCGQKCVPSHERCCPNCGRVVENLPPEGVLVPEVPSVPGAGVPHTHTPPGSTPGLPTPVPIDPGTSQPPTAPTQPQENTPAPDTPSQAPVPSTNDFGDFSPQSPVTTASAFAAAPPTIDLNFGAGSSTVTVTAFQNFQARGTIVSGVAGDANSDLSFDITPEDFVPDLISVGLGRDDRNPPDGIDTFDVEELVPGGVLTPPHGTDFDGATATRNAGTDSYIDNEIWDVEARYTSSIEVPNPSATVVGRLKIGENSSPMPRERIFLNYSYFDDVPLRPGDVGVHRFSPGFEILLNENASFELRTPFASTASSGFALDGATSTGLEFGDIFLIFKQAIAKTDDILLSIGYGMTLPTADDLEVSLANGGELIHVDHQTIHIQPFVGYMLMLTERLFVQGFLQLDIDVRGNAVQLNPDLQPTTGLQNAGRIRDTMLLYNDIAFGYWIRKQGEHCEKLLTSIVPMLELHIANSLEPNDTVTLGNLTLGQVGDGVQNTTFVFGTHFGIKNREQITFGYAQPVGNRSDQVFDGELRVFWNRYF